MKKIAVILILSLVLTSCASTFQYVKMPDTNNQEMATIYVLRPSSYGSAVKFRVYEGDSLIGRLGPKSYLAWNIKPEGKEVTIVSRSENKDTFIINPKAGKTYYIKQRVKMGFAFARTGLEQLDQAEGKKILRRLKKPKLNYAE